jgi:hypothetical protein
MMRCGPAFCGNCEQQGPRKQHASANVRSGLGSWVCCSLRPYCSTAPLHASAHQCSSSRWSRTQQQQQAAAMPGAAAAAAAAARSSSSTHAQQQRQEAPATPMLSSNLKRDSLLAPSKPPLHPGTCHSSCSGAELPFAAVALEPEVAPVPVT